MKSFLIFLFSIQVLLFSCDSKESKQFELTSNERSLCNTLQIDSTIIGDIRLYCNGKIKPFEYSYSILDEATNELKEETVFRNGIMFPLKSSKSRSVIASLSEKLRLKGYTIFIFEDNSFDSTELDIIGVLKTQDKFSVLKHVETNGINYEIDNDSVVNILKKFDKKYDLQLIGAGYDWCEFRVKNKGINWNEFAREVYEVCPDVVDQGTESIEELAREMQSDSMLFLWWD